MSEGRAGRGCGLQDRGGREFRGLPWGIRDAGALRGVKQTRRLG